MARCGDHQGLRGLNGQAQKRHAAAPSPSLQLPAPPSATRAPVQPEGTVGEMPRSLAFVGYVRTWCHLLSEGSTVCGPVHPSAPWEGRGYPVRGMHSAGSPWPQPCVLPAGPPSGGSRTLSG